MTSRHVLAGMVAAALATLVPGAPAASAQTPAKKLFGAKRLPAATSPKVHGFYSKGCIQGAIAIPADGPHWQAMRLNRNRRWGHPELVKLVARLGRDGRKVGWNGLLVGDLSQPRGGPMLTGHASHQIGLDADIWLNPMPNRRYTRAERDEGTGKTVSAQSMLTWRKGRNGKARLDQNTIGARFTQATYGIIKTAASYGEVERVLVHPTIKRELCRRSRGETDRRWLHKVRPYWGHHYHMHIRMGCPADSPGCRPQAKPAADDGCGKELAYWHRQLNPPPRKKTAPKKKPKVVKKRRRREKILSDLPRACVGVLRAAAPVSEQAATLRLAGGTALAPTPQPAARAGADAIGDLIRGPVTKPTFRPARDGGLTGG